MMNNGQNSMVLEQPKFNSLPNLDQKKATVLKALKSKVEQAKLDLIYTELEEANIPFERKYATVKELEADLKMDLSGLDYNKSKTIIDKIDHQLNATVDELSNGSTNAFTKLMTSDLTKTISKTLGISLAGRTALLLAPTVATKAMVGAMITGYSLYRVIKSRKEIKQINENNELNTILSELETTMENDIILDTRFNSEAQELIREHFRKTGIEFQDTGYRSLRQAMYSLPADQKRGLVDLLNVKFARGINVQERISKAKRKLNVAASTATTIGLGAKFGSNLATTINGVDPGLLSGLINGTFLATWAEATSKKEWFASLSGGLGFIGTEVLERLPIVGGTFKNIFATQNLAALSALGATGGLVAGVTLGLASGIKQIYHYAKNKQMNEQFLKQDAEKYRDDDQKEMELIRQKLLEPRNNLELIVTDIVVGALTDQDIHLEHPPKSISDLKNVIDSLEEADKLKAKKILVRVEDSLHDKDLKSQFLQAGKISVALFTAGLAAMSVYDIIKNGTFLPELSKKLFPENNLYNPVEIPAGAGTALDPVKESAELEESAKMLDEFDSDAYKHADTASNYLVDTAQDAVNESEKMADESWIKWFGRQVGMSGRLEVAGNYALGDAVVDQFIQKTGDDIIQELVPDKVAISQKLNELTSDKLLLFMRYMNNSDLVQTDMNQTIKEILSSSTYINKISEYIASFEAVQKKHDFVIDITKKFAIGLVPFSVFAGALGVAQKNNTNDEFVIHDREINGKVQEKSEESEKGKQL